MSSASGLQVSPDGSGGTAPPITPADAWHYIMLTILNIKLGDSALRKVLIDSLQLDLADNSTLDLNTIFLIPEDFNEIWSSFRLANSRLLPVSDYNRLRHFRLYAQHLAGEFGHPPTPHEWFSVSRDTFYAWIARPCDRFDTAVDLTTQLITEQESLSSWRRGMHRDPSAFPTLKSEEQCISFQEEFEVQASAQGVEDVLDAPLMPQHGTV